MRAAGPARAVAGLLVGLVLAEGLAQGLLASSAFRQRLHAGAWPVVAAVEWARHARAGLGDPGDVHRYDPVLGWALAPGGRYDVPGGRGTVGADGWRRVVAPAAAARARSVTLYGDSFVFGWGVADDATMASDLARLRPDLAVADHGVPGYGLDQAWLAWRRDPHPVGGVVVVGVPAVLLPRTVEPFHVYVRPNVAAEAGRFTPDPVPPPEVVRDRLAWTPALLTLVRAVRWAAFQRSEDFGALVDSRVDALFDRLADEVGEARQTLVVLLLPTPAVGGAADLRASGRWLRDKTAKVCAREEVLCVDPTEALAIEADRPGFLVGGHYGPAAQRILAGLLADALPAPAAAAALP